MRRERKSISVLGVILGCTLSVTIATSLRSQPAYPMKPINVLVGFAPGGMVDVSGRLLAGKTEKYLGQSFVFSNNGGGGGSVAIAITTTKPPDGYSLAGCASTGLVRIPHFRTVPYKFDDLVPIMQYAEPHTGIVVKSSSGWKTFKEFVEYAKKNPGKVKYSTTGVGTPQHQSMELVAKQEGIVWTHVPYPGTMPAFMALLGGHVTAQVGSGEFIPYVKDGTLRLLATQGERRIKTFPDVPTMKELGYDFYNETVFLFAAPKGTPQYIIDKFDDALHKAMADPEAIAGLEKLELVPTYRNSADTEEIP
jgi:tripartite-type tricarboxylate transporter receptor subunit TctC